MVYNSIMNYEELVRSQPKISNQDFSPIVASNVLLPEHIEEIYEKVASTSEAQTRIQPWAGHKVWDIPFSKSIENRITQVAQELLGIDVVLNYDYSFARYSQKFGYECKLFPHYDNRESQRITFDLQLRATEKWGVVVENETFYLEDNQALLFAGTQQIHWRENKRISDDAEIDMIFCHLEYASPLELDKNQKEVLDERAVFLMNKTGISNEVIINEA
jgi:hypothetical protein